MGGKKGHRNGSPDSLLPIDLALLEILPDEGQMMGFNPIALQVKTILERPEFKHEKGGQISGRLRSMAHFGLTVNQVVLPVQRGLGWQRTAAGKAALERHKKREKGAVVA